MRKKEVILLRITVVIYHVGITAAMSFENDKMCRQRCCRAKAV